MKSLLAAHKFALLAILLCPFLLSGQVTEPSSDTPANMKTLIKSYYDCWNKGTVNALDEILSEDYVRHEDGNSQQASIGREAIKDNLTLMRGAYFNQLNLMAQLGYTLSAPNQSTANTTQATGKVMMNGILLSAAQLAQLESRYRVKAQSGNYWYDAKSGLYGIVGQPAVGFMYPDHNFSKLARNASNGNTGVIVNGRELPQAEWAVWSQILGYWIQRGSYWFDAKGNAGYEGNPMPLVNFYVAATQNAYKGNPGGGGGFWSTRFSAGNSYAGNQTGYVSLPGGGIVGYGK